MESWNNIKSPFFFGTLEKSLVHCLRQDSHVARLLATPVAFSAASLHATAGIATAAECAFKGLVNVFGSAISAQFSFKLGVQQLFIGSGWGLNYLMLCLFDLTVMPVVTLLRPQAFNAKFAAARKILEVSTCASEETIKKSYRRLALQCHPDKCQGSTEQFIRLQKAYETLTGKHQDPVDVLEELFPLSAAVLMAFQKMPSPACQTESYRVKSIAS